MEEGYTSNQNYIGPVNLNMKENYQSAEPNVKPNEKRVHKKKKHESNNRGMNNAAIPCNVVSKNSSPVYNNINLISPHAPSLYGLHSSKEIVDNSNNIQNNIVVTESIPKKKGEENQIGFKDLPEFERTIRIGFIRKVFGIFTFQLLITFGLVCLTFISSVKLFVIKFDWIFYIAIGGSVIILLVLVCGTKIAKKVPLNYILLFLWTIFESYMLMYASAFYDYETVLSAIGITIGLSAGITVFACFTKINFSFLGQFLAGFVMLLVIMAMFGFIFSKWLRVVFCACGALVFLLYILYDTHRILGNFREKYDIDDYIVAALNIYMDIVNLFLMILCLLGTLTSKK